MMWTAHCVDYDSKMGMKKRWLCGLALVALCAPSYAGDWPFGGDKANRMMRGGDYFNLGLIGAKAKSGDDEPIKGDVGPNELEIVLLFPDGPGAKAGLQVGDEVIGIGRKVFKDGSLEPLAEALVKAESGKKKGVLTLLVMRDGEKTSLDVAIPQGGKVASKPTKPKGRAAIFAKALVFLCEAQKATGGYPETLSGSSGAAIQTSLAGLAWMAGGSDAKGGTYQTNVRKATDFVARWCTNTAGGVLEEGRPDPRMRGGKSNWNQDNWGFAHGAVFLGAVQLRTPDDEVKQALFAAAKALLDAQEKSGGWAHGPGGPNALGYVELNILTGLALWGLGMARQCGYDVPDEALEKAETYLIASSSGDGGVGYADKPGQKGQGNIGRTAGAYLGYLALGLHKNAWAGKMRKYVERNSGNVLGGHASLMQHIFLAGVASQAVGKSAASAFWKALERDLVLGRAPDGSIQPRPWHESLRMSSNSDVTFGEVWTTAAWALVLGCDSLGPDHPGIPSLWGKPLPAGR